MMTGAQKLKDRFASGQLVKPSSEALNFVDLIRCLAVLSGAEGFDAGPGVDALCRMIGPAEHYVLVLVDGMGMNQLERLPKGGFLRSSRTVVLQAVFLSTTATALTTLATGQWPGTHGVPGWWTYLEGPRISAVTLPFVERATERPLEEWGVTIDDLFPLPSFWPDLKHTPLSVVPQGIAGSAYSNYVSGGTTRVGYADLADAFEKARDAVLKASSPSLTYLYLPHLDTLCHRKGTRDQGVLALLVTLDRYLFRLHDSLSGRARILISADHGQTDVPAERRFLLSEGDSILSHLRCLPTGEPNVPIFHARPGHEARFEEEFNDRFGRLFALLTPGEIEGLCLLGPDPVTDTMKARLGTFVGIAADTAALFAGPPEKSGFRNEGYHGGLSGEEMLVPLIVADP